MRWYARRAGSTTRATNVIEKAVAAWCIFWLTVLLSLWLALLAIDIVFILIVVVPYRKLTGKHSVEVFGNRIAI